MKHHNVAWACLLIGRIPMSLAAPSERDEGMCTMRIGEIINCSKPYPSGDLEASYTIRGTNGEVIPGASLPSSKSVPINDNDPHVVKVGDKSLKIIGEHTHDYIQFYYGDDVSWATNKPNDGASCKLVPGGRVWYNDHKSHGGYGCPNNDPVWSLTRLNYSVRRS